MINQGTEVLFDADDLIVSKTDLTGRIIYANDIFLDVAGYNEEEVVGKPHNIIRHSFMPKSIFAFMWKRLKEKREVFAYVVNSTKNGDYYWVLAHVTPSYKGGEVIGYHSTRRVPNKQVLKQVIEPLYEEMGRLEASAGSLKAGMDSSAAYLTKILEQRGQEYNEFMADLQKMGG